MISFCPEEECVRKSPKKLVLSRETLVNLEQDRLAQAVRGGTMMSDGGTCAGFTDTCGGSLYCSLNACNTN